LGVKRIGNDRHLFAFDLERRMAEVSNFHHNFIVAKVVYSWQEMSYLSFLFDHDRW
jgi:hypothetical protein